MLIKGKNAYRWMERLAPYLDGEHDREDLLAGLDSDRASTVRDLINALHANHFVRDVAEDLPHDLHDGLLREYASEIGFLDSFRDSGAFRFSQFRACRVLLIGSGLSMSALVRAALNSGLQHVGVHITQECESDYQVDLHEVERSRRDTEQTLFAVPPITWTDEAVVADILAPFAAVIHISDRPMLGRAQLLTRICAAQMKPFLQAVTVEDHTWIGPLTGGTAGSCWECAWRCLQANVQQLDERFLQYAFEDRSSAPISRFLAIPTAGIVANRLIFEVFKYVAEAGPRELGDSIVALNLETLESQRRRFRPHPLCTTCSSAGAPSRTEFLDTVQNLALGEPLDSDTFSHEAARMFDSHTGILSALDEGDISQMPLFVSTANVSNPMHVNLPEDPMTVFGAGTSFRIARRCATQRGIEAYAALLVDRRRLLDTLPPVDGLTAEPIERFWAASSAPPSQSVGSESWAWAYMLDTQEGHLVPAVVAFPAMRGSIGWDDIELGVASGMTWAEAVTRALLGWCRHLTLCEMQNASETTYPQVDLSAVSLEPEGTRQRRVLDLVSEMVTVYEVTGALRVPTFAICIDDEVAALATDTNVNRALREGFEQALLYYQLRGEQVAEFRPVQVPETFSALHGQTQIIPTPVTGEEWPACQQRIQQALHDLGWQPFVIPLDHDPTVRRTLPYLVRVLLARGQSESS